MLSPSSTEGTSTGMMVSGRYRMQTTFPDGTEMVEEYNLQAGVVHSRKWREANTFGRLGAWQYEIGDPPSTHGGSSGGGSTGGGGVDMRAAGGQPTFHARDHREYWEWRVRNVPYPIDVYSVTVDDSAQELILRTSNRKYYKRFTIPVMRRLELPITESDGIELEHNDNTLVIRYLKPDNVQQLEQEQRRRVQENLESQQNGECKQS